MAVGSGGGPAVQTRTLQCGQATRAGAPGRWNPTCGVPQTCLRTLPDGTQVPSNAFATQTKTNGTWSAATVWCPANAQPQATLAAIQDHATRLLPHVAIATTHTGPVLVNTDTILWAATSPDRTLGSVSVVGQPVAIRIHFEHADWNFGDARTDTPTTPGTPYDPTGNPCATAQCPDYYGHTYARTGRMTLTLAITWTAQYSLDRTTWTDIPTPITGPRSSTTITVKQARGVLIPN